MNIDMNKILELRKVAGINVKELDEERNELLDYLDKLRKENITEYQREMAEFFNDDYGVIIGPKSFSGKVYKYNSGVIGINQNGDKEEIIIDETNYNHSSSTIKIGCLLSKSFNNYYNGKSVIVTPYEIGTILSDYGVLLIQLEGDSMFVYLPFNELSDVQNILLQQELDVRYDLFKIRYIKGGKALDNFDFIKK